MKIRKDSTPSADGFRMLGEFERHQGCIMIFPERPDSWQYGGYAARKAFVQAVDRMVREAAEKGAQLLLYPTAIGSEPIIECDSMPHWRRCM